MNRYYYYRRLMRHSTFSGKVSAVFVLALFLHLQLFAQTPGVIPPSPNMATMTRFGDYPVSYATGLPQIEIPLYEVKLKDYVFPVKIQFHASGRRADFNFSPLGVGWSLDATGYISREIRGKPDDGAGVRGLELSAESLHSNPSAYDSLIKADDSVPSEYLVYPFDTENDAQHDLFSFSVNGISGKYVFDKTYTPLFLDYKPYQITSVAAGSSIGGFILTDDKGIKYEFGYAPNSIETMDMSMPTIFGYRFSTGWFLTKITTPSGEIISFNYGQKYTGVSNTDDLVGTYIKTKDFKTGDGISYMTPDLLSYYQAQIEGPRLNYNNSGNDYAISYLKEIVFSTGKVTFSYDDNSLKLLNMEVRNTSAEVIKKVSFTYIQTPGTNFYLPNNNSTSLSAMQITGMNSSPAGNYSFDYYDDHLPEYDDESRSYYRGDWWGYQSSRGDKPPYDYTLGTLDYQDCASCKAPEFNSVRSGMLRKIRYPTGGSSEFIYESNLYGYGNVETGPGLRISKIISDPGAGKAKITKQYKYGTNEDGLGYLPHWPTCYDFQTEMGYWHFAYLPESAGYVYVGKYHVRYFNVKPISEMAEAYQQPVYYSKVTEYLLTENDTPNGKTEYFFNLPEFEEDNPNVHTFKKREWTHERLAAKITYKYNPDLHDYRAVEEQRFSYQQFKYTKIPQIRIRRRNMVKEVSPGESYERLLATQNQGISLGDVFDWEDFSIESATEKQTEQIVTIYDESNSAVETRTEYFYDNLWHTEPTRTLVSVSNGEKISTEIKYTGDMPEIYQSTDPFLQGYNNLLNKNIIKPIETSVYRLGSDPADKRLISSRLFSYFPAQSNLNKVYTVESVKPLTDFSPLNVQNNAFIKDTRYQEKHSFDRYDEKGNLLQEHQSNGTNTVYIWSYMGEYPVAKIEDADYTTVVNILGGSSAVTDFNNKYPTDAELEAFLSPLRVHPSLTNARVSTYTYQTLYGVTSMADPKGLKTHYEYDNNQRLIMIKDNDGNIVKKFSYHYAGQ